MNYCSYTFISMVWEVKTTDEYDTWFLNLTENGQEAVRMKVELYLSAGTRREKVKSCFIGI